MLRPKIGVEMSRFGGLLRHRLQLLHSKDAYSRRAFSLYDQLNVLNAAAEDGRRLRIDGYGDDGFDVNGVFYEGSVICLSGLILTWRPNTFAEITPDSLSLFQLLRPAPDILLLGCGRKIERVGPDVRNFLRSNGIKLEAIDSANAASTFNFLNEEGRLVAAALLPYGSSS